MRDFSQISLPKNLIATCLLITAFTLVGLAIPQSVYAATVVPVSVSSPKTVTRISVSSEPMSAPFCDALLKAHPALAHNPNACIAHTTIRTSITRVATITSNGCAIYDVAASATYNGGPFGNELYLDFSYSPCTNVNVNIYYENCNRDTWGYGFAVTVTYCGNYRPAGYSAAYAMLAEDDFTASFVYNGSPFFQTHNIYIQCDGGASGWGGYWFDSMD